jgi:hypothetical protein
VDTLLIELAKQAPNTVAIIVVVIIFLNAISKRDADQCKKDEKRDENQKERDGEWRSFFKDLVATTAQDASKRMQLTEAILEMVKEVLAVCKSTLEAIQAVKRSLDEHDDKVDARIDAAQKATEAAIRRKPSP